MTGKADAVNFMVKYRTVLAIVLVVVVISGSAVNIAFSTLPTATVATYNNLAGARDCSYLISTNGSTIYAQNCNTGAIDYSGTSAATVIQSAINALSSGGKVFIKAGTYTITSNIKPASNVVVQGEGMNNTILKVSGTNGVWIKNDATAMSNFSIMDMTLDGSSTSNALVNFNSNADNFNIIRCYLKSSASFLAFHVGNVENSIFDGTGNVGTNDLLAGFVANSHITNNVFKNAPQEGLTSGSTANATITGNQFISIGTKAISLESSGKIQNVVIADNVFRGSGTYDVQLFNSGFPIGNITIANNIGQSGVTIGQNGASNYNTVIGNKFAFISVSNGVDNTISNNYLSGGTGNGAIVLFSGSSKSRVIGNLIYNASQNGIWVQASNYNTIIGNFIDSPGLGAANTYDGIQLLTSGLATNNNIISGNTILAATGITRYGINVNSGTNHIITGNDLTGTFATSGLNLAGSGPGGDIVKFNKGFVTENRGTGTIASGTTSVVINHGLGFAPTAGEITITWSNNPTNNPGNWWVSSITSTQFTVNVRSDPGAGGATFSWAAARLNS